MNKTERILIAAIAFYLVIMCLTGFSQNAIAKKRLNAVEIRLQNIEHLFSLVISESRSPALAGLTNRVLNVTNASKQGSDFEIK